METPTCKECYLKTNILSKKELKDDHLLTIDFL